MSACSMTSIIHGQHGQFRSTATGAGGHERQGMFEATAYVITRHVICVALRQAPATAVSQSMAADILA